MTQEQFNWSFKSDNGIHFLFPLKQNEQMKNAFDQNNIHYQIEKSDFTGEERISVHSTDIAVYMHQIGILEFGEFGLSEVMDHLGILFDTIKGGDNYC